MVSDLYIRITPTTDTSEGFCDVWKTFGVRMGDGFLDAIGSPVDFKPYVSNESRISNGKRIADTRGVMNSRELSLTFRVTCADGEYRDGVWHPYSLEEARQSLLARKKAFLDLMFGKYTDIDGKTDYTRKIDLYIPKYDKTEMYRLIYTGKGTSHSINLARTSCSMTLKFEEYNPSNRQVPEGLYEKLLTDK